MYIKVKTSVDEYSNTHRYANAEIMESIPAVGLSYNHETVVDVYPAVIDCENTDEVFGYDYFRIVTEYDDDGEKQQENYLVAIKKPEYSYEEQKAIEYVVSKLKEHEEIAADTTVDSLINGDFLSIVPTRDNKRKVVWYLDYTNINGTELCVYVDTLEKLSREEIEEEVE